MGARYRSSNGEPSTIGSTLPGFVVSRSVRPATLALLGEHRFSRYALVFYIDEVGSGRTRLRAETRAEFPGARGRAYWTFLNRDSRPRPLGPPNAGRRQRARRALRREARPGHPARLGGGIRARLAGAGTDSLKELFAEDASYSPAPYARPHIGLDAIARMWEAERVGPEEAFEMQSEIVAIEGDTGVVRVEVRYGRPKRQEYRDLWVIRLDAEERCTHFEEWPFWPPGTEGTAASGAEPA